MLRSTALGSASRKISQSQTRHAVGPSDARCFSQYISISRSIRRTTLGANRLTPVQQSRSLSLFGWNLSKPADDFAKTHPQSTQSVDSTPVAPTVESIRTVKASHATSDAPDPTSATPLEQNPIQSIENSVLQSQNALTPTTTLPDTPDIASVPEAIGYLKNVCGLDFGWGPTSMMEFLLEHIHITGGLSWSASIIVLVVLIRGAIYPLAVSASDNTARYQEIQPALKALTEKSSAALKVHDRAAMMEAQMEMRELKKDSGVSFLKMFRPIFFQVPLGYGAWKLLGSCSTLPVPSFETEQFLWLSNLAVGDPVYILPVLTAGITWLNLNTTKHQTASVDMPGQAALRNIIPMITFGFLLFQPASVQIYFIMSGVLTQLQVSSLQNPAFRRMLNLKALRLPRKPEDSSPSSTFAHMNLSPNSKVIDATARTKSTSGTSSAETTTPSPPTPTPTTTTERSFIDKGVDSIKSNTQAVWRKATGSTREKVEEKAREQKAQAQKTSADRYEAQRKLDEEQMRRARNAMQARRGKTGSGRG